MIVQTFEFVCDLCDRHAREQMELPVGYVTSSPSITTLPAGWKYVGNQLLCPLHTVKIDPRPESI